MARYRMKKQLFTEEDRKIRLKAVRWQSIVVPVGFLMIFFIFRVAGWQRFAYVAAAAANIVGARAWLRQLRVYVTRLKGADRELFMVLYEQLSDYADADDVLRVVQTLEKMAEVSQSGILDVREFAFQNAGVFLGRQGSRVLGRQDSRGRLPLRLYSRSMCIAAHDILHAELADLPQFLSSEQKWERDIATHRLAELRCR